MAKKESIVHVLKVRDMFDSQESCHMKPSQVTCQPTYEHLHQGKLGAEAVRLPPASFSTDQGKCNQLKPRVQERKGDSRSLHNSIPRYPGSGQHPR